jgi:hypothetical protein
MSSTFWPTTWATRSAGFSVELIRTLLPDVLDATPEC